MPTGNYKPGQIVTILPPIAVQMANGKTAPLACKEAAIHTQTDYRWRQEYWEMKVEQAKTAAGVVEGERSPAAPGGGAVAGEAGAAGCGTGKLLSLARRRCAVEQRMGSRQVLEPLSDVLLWREIPEHIRSDNGPEFIAQELRQWLGKLGTGTLYIESGSLWENGYCESFNGQLRDEHLNGEVFYSLQETRIVIGQWRKEYNTRRPHSALG